MNNQPLAERLKYFRKMNGLSQEELSNKTNVTVRTIQRIENAEVNPHLNTIKLLAVALDIEIGELLPLDNPKEETIKKKWLLLIHATPLLGMFIPLGNVLIPLFLWIHKREDNPIYDKHGIKVVNFQITMLLLAILSFVSLLTIEMWGVIMFIAFIPICIVIIIFNIIYVFQKEKCYYPFSIPFLRSKSSVSSKLLGLLIVATAFSSCSQKEHREIESLDSSKISIDSITQKINQLTNEANVHGMSVAIFNNNQPVYEHIEGYKDYPKRLLLTDSTNIYGASLSKAIFGVLVMKLVEEKIINLDIPLESYLPKKIYEYKPLTRWHDDFSDLREDSLYKNITARMCLTHTTGFANSRGQEPDEKLRVNGIPGERYSYSGEGFIYLQVVLEKITGKGLEQLAQEIIFEPLAMKNSSYEWKTAFENDFAYGHMSDGNIYPKDKDNEPRGGSTLETTFGDYIKFLTAVLNKEIISPSSYAAIFSRHIEIHSLTQFGEGAKVDTDKYDDFKLGYGLGWGYLETPHGKGVFKEGHGNGFQHYSILFPESGKGILIMSNSDNAEGIYRSLLEYCFLADDLPWDWYGYVPFK